MANMNGHATQTFSPSVGSQDFVTVQSSGTLAHRNFNLGLFLNHAGDNLPYEQEKQSDSNTSLTSMDLMVAYGITRRFELGMIAPFAVAQSIRNDETHSEFTAKGNTELRPYAKYKLIESYPFGLGIVGNINVNRLIDDPYAGGGSGLGGSIELAADWMLNAVRFAFNLGYRYSPVGKPISDALSQPLGDRILASAGAGFSMTKSAHLITELYGSKPTKKFENQTDRKPENLEILGGLQYLFGPDTKAQMGLTTEAMHGMNSADWRAFVGINQLFGPQKQRTKPIVRKKDAPIKRVNDYVAKSDPQLEKPLPEIPDEPTEIMPNQTPSYAPIETFVLRDVHFEFDSDYQILKGGLTELQKIADKLKLIDFDQVIVEGHCDFYGSDAYNDDLSMRRSRNVARNLIRQHGIDAGLVNFVGFGEKKPKTPDRSDFGRQINRRVEIKIYRGGALEMSSQ
jgi:outer membrane protein OmpA-like peptidoglycan-associated protein